MIAASVRATDEIVLTKKLEKLVGTGEGCRVVIHEVMEEAYTEFRLCSVKYGIEHWAVFRIDNFQLRNTKHNVLDSEFTYAAHRLLKRTNDYIAKEVESGRLK